MGTQRKKRKKTEKKCIECNGLMELIQIEEKDVPCNAFRCKKCGHTVVTIEQMREYNRLKEFASAVPEKRKIVKIGNSLGFTLPVSLKKFGINEGKEIEVKVIDAHNLAIKLP